MITRNAKFATLLALTRLSQTEVATASGIPRHRISALLTDDLEARPEEKQKISAGISKLLLRKISADDLWSVYSDMPTEDAIREVLPLRANDERLHALLSDLIFTVSEIQSALGITTIGSAR